jgi:hypothetical protein
MVDDKSCGKTPAVVAAGATVIVKCGVGKD